MGTRLALVVYLRIVGDGRAADGARIVGSAGSARLVGYGGNGVAWAEDEGL